MTIMKELLSELNQLIADFTKDANLQAENGVKAAGTRARKASLAIEKQLKEFRKLSIEASKN
jgi:hypothetical protein